MRKYLFMLALGALVLLTMNIAAASSVISSDGYYKGIKLCGRVKVVDNFPDIKIQTVNVFPDLRVHVVSSLPNNIGEWQFVDSGEDFTIQFVDNFPDIKIQFVDNFPGVE